MLIQALNHFKFYFMIHIVVTHELLFMTRWLTYGTWTPGCLFVRVLALMWHK